MSLPWLSRRKVRWPRFDYYQDAGPSQVKHLSVDQLGKLSAKAERNEWSAEGRPDWLRRYADNIAFLYLTIFGHDDDDLFRCIVTAILIDGSGCRFTLDVDETSLRSLPDIDEMQLITLAHKYLATFPSLPLDEQQNRSWQISE